MPGGIQTLNLMITRRLLYRWATTAAHSSGINTIIITVIIIVIITPTTCDSGIPVENEIGPNLVRHHFGHFFRPRFRNQRLRPETEDSVRSGQKNSGPDSGEWQECSGWLEPSRFREIPPVFGPRAREVKKPDFYLERPRQCPRFLSLNLISLAIVCAG